MKVNFTRVFVKEKVLISGQKEVNMKVNGQKERYMEKATWNILTMISLVVNLSMDLKRVMVFICMQMGIHMKDHLRKT